MRAHAPRLRLPADGEHFAQHGARVTRACEAEDHDGPVTVLSDPADCGRRRDRMQTISYGCPICQWQKLF